MKEKTILSLCDYSGVWSDPYRDAGYMVTQIDLKHGQDVRLLEYPGQVYGILAAPPCTMFAASGARWERTPEQMKEALALVDACLRFVAICKPKFWALENPVGKLSKYLGKPRMYFQPCDYGDPYTKKTCLWGDFVPPLPLFLGADMSVDPVEGSKLWKNYGGKSERTKEARSQTPKGFAQAFFMVNQ
jgi:hypothetical protein